MRARLIFLLALRSMVSQDARRDVFDMLKTIRGLPTRLRFMTGPRSWLRQPDVAFSWALLGILSLVVHGKQMGHGKRNQFVRHSCACVSFLVCLLLFGAALPVLALSLGRAAGFVPLSHDVQVLRVLTGGAGLGGQNISSARLQLLAQDCGCSNLRRVRMWSK